jgi:hypothetical protein
VFDTRTTHARVSAPAIFIRGASNRGTRIADRATRPVWTGLMLVALFALGACSTKPPQPEEAKELAAKVEPLSEYMSRAQAAEAAEGGRERARVIYREAAQSYPTDKRPWLRLAQSYFDASDYGNAVLAAQEVVQRDSADSVAQGLLAVSGLRISTTALSALRNQNNLTTSARSEAEDMARNLRTILGESVLVPKPADTAQEGVAPRAPARPRVPARPRTARPANAASPAAAAPAPVVPSQQPSNNPFGALK